MPTKQQLETALFNADKAGDTSAAKQLANAIKSQKFDSGSFPGAGFIEPALSVASAIPASIASGVTGLVAGAVGGNEAAASVQKEVQEDLTFEPKTEAGKEGLQTLGDIVKFGGDVLNVPLSGLTGLVELISSGFDVDKAAETVRSTQQQGIKKELGEQAFEATGSPAVATLAELIPDIAMTAIGLKGAPKVKQVGKELSAQAKQAGTLTAQELAPIAEAGGQLVKDIKRFQTPKTREIARQLKKGDINSDTAQRMLVDEGIANPTVRQKLLGADLPQAVKDTPVINASRQGFDDGFLDTVKKNTSNADKELLVKMTNISQARTKNPLLKAKTRPANVAGDVLLQKVNEIKSINRAAGKQIGASKKFLKGQQVPVAQIGDSFLTSLDDLKIAIKPDGKLDFKDALISGAGRRKAISDIFERMSRNKNPDALDLHELKQFIDDTVSYGKTVRGLGGKAENALKELRVNIKTSLDENFPKYAEANKAYSDTIQALDEIQRLAGSKTDLTSNSAAGQLGILARRITSNAQSRGQVLESVDQLEQVLKTHAGFGGQKRIAGKGGDPSPQLDVLMLYADELDRVVGNAATTSFTGAGETAIKAARGPKEFVTEKAIEAARGIQGVSEENAFKTMREFLKSELKKKP
tara:strand:- start:2988 stop:4910 length:1923 start_codon:yes stop_codon:yes gene_type:complete